MRVSQRALGAAAATVLFASAAFAADTAPTPLPAGKAAGTHEALLTSPTLLVLTGIAIIGIGIGFAVGGNHGSSTPSTTGTGA